MASVLGSRDCLCETLTVEQLLRELEAPDCTPEERLVLLGIRPKSSISALVAGAENQPPPVGPLPQELSRILTKRPRASWSLEAAAAPERTMGHAPSRLYSSSACLGALEGASTPFGTVHGSSSSSEALGLYLGLGEGGMAPRAHSPMDNGAAATSKGTAAAAVFICTSGAGGAVAAAQQAGRCGTLLTSA